MAIDGEISSNIAIIDTIARHRVVSGGAIVFSRLSCKFRLQLRSEIEQGFVKLLHGLITE